MNILAAGHDFGHLTSPAPATDFATMPGKRFVDELASARRTSDEAEGRKAAEALVSAAFVTPVLALVRESSMMADGPFQPGAAERRFGPLLDQRIADEVVEAANFPLVDVIQERIFGASASTVDIKS